MERIEELRSEYSFSKTLHHLLSSATIRAPYPNNFIDNRTIDSRRDIDGRVAIDNRPIDDLLITQKTDQSMILNNQNHPLITDNQLGSDNERTSSSSSTPPSLNNRSQQSNGSSSPQLMQQLNQQSIVTSMPSMPIIAQNNQHSFDHVLSGEPQQVTRTIRTLPRIVSKSSEPSDKVPNDGQEQFSGPSLKISKDSVSWRHSDKRKRERMNNSLVDLGKLIPYAYSQKLRGKVEKTEIVELAVKYLKHMHRHNGGPANSSNPSPEARPASNSDSSWRHLMVLNDEDKVREYNKGYRDCVAEMVKFLTTEGIAPGEPFCVKLVNHLLGALDTEDSGQLKSTESEKQSSADSEVNAKAIVEFKEDNTGHSDDGDRLVSAEKKAVVERWTQTDNQDSESNTSPISSKNHLVRLEPNDRCLPSFKIESPGGRITELSQSPPKPTPRASSADSNNHDQIKRPPSCEIEYVGQGKRRMSSPFNSENSQDNSVSAAGFKKRISARYIDDQKQSVNPVLFANHQVQAGPVSSHKAQLEVRPTPMVRQGPSPNHFPQKKHCSHSQHTSGQSHPVPLHQMSIQEFRAHQHRILQNMQGGHSSHRTLAEAGQSDLANSSSNSLLKMQLLQQQQQQQHSLMFNRHREQQPEIRVPVPVPGKLQQEMAAHQRDLSASVGHQRPPNGPAAYQGTQRGQVGHAGPGAGQSAIKTIPAFGLHPSGNYYITVSIPETAFEIVSNRNHNQVNLYPVSINVDFNKSYEAK
ncbi:hypothetical protein HDE_10439 [Halotydeus destructor]|nr:hypothetical protein HDE_10439 [Halotydeus destructor]